MASNEKYIMPLPGTVMPCIPVRGSVAFPGITVNLELTRDICKNAFDLANEGDGFVFLVYQAELSADMPEDQDLFHIGTVAKIKQSVKGADGTVRALFEGAYRAVTGQFIFARRMIRAQLIARELLPEGKTTRRCAVR